MLDQVILEMKHALLLFENRLVVLEIVLNGRLEQRVLERSGIVSYLECRSSYNSVSPDIMKNLFHFRSYCIKNCNFQARNFSIKFTLLLIIMNYFNYY